MRTVPRLSPLDARILRACDPDRVRPPARIGELAGCAPDVARSRLVALRVSYLVEDDGERPQRFIRMPRGDVALEHAP